jgi:hypothetical protein
MSTPWCNIFFFFFSIFPCVEATSVPSLMQGVGAMFRYWSGFWRAVRVSYFSTSELVGC